MMASRVTIINCLHRQQPLTVPLAALRDYPNSLLGQMAEAMEERCEQARPDGMVLEFSCEDHTALAMAVHVHQHRSLFGGPLPALPTTNNGNTDLHQWLTRDVLDKFCLPAMHELCIDPGKAAPGTLHQLMQAYDVDVSMHATGKVQELMIRGADAIRQRRAMFAIGLGRRHGIGASRTDDGNAPYGLVVLRVEKSPQETPQVSAFHGVCDPRLLLEAVYGRWLLDYPSGQCPNVQLLCTQRFYGEAVY